MRTKRKKAVTTTNALQLCLFSEAVMSEMAEQIDLTQFSSDPIRDLFILPWLAGRAYRQQRSMLTGKRRKRDITAFKRETIISGSINLLI